MNHATRLPALSLKPLLISLLLFIVVAAFCKSQLAPIEPLAASASEDVFSSERAFNMLQSITREQVPHAVDSPANRVVEERIVSLLREMGYQEEIQETQACADYDRGIARCSKIRNIIVEIEGSEQGKGILLSAHYDSVAAGPGASDAGAAVGTLLETARLLSRASKPRNTIVLLFNEGEEVGLLGAEAFMKKHPLATRLQLAINVEARGTTGQSVMFETGEDSGWLVEHYSATTKAPLSSSLFYEVYKFLPNDTDLTVYKKHGLQGLNFAHAERLVHYHTPLDNLANLNRGSLQHHGDNVWGVLGTIKDIDLSAVKKGNLVYTDILGLFVVQWQETSSLYASIVAFILLLVLIVALKRKALIAPIQIGKVVLASILILFTSVLMAIGIKWLTQLISSSDYPWYSNTLPMQIAIWSGTVLLSFLIGRALSKNATYVDALVGLTLIWCLLSIASSASMPGISFLFIIPAAVSLIALSLLAYSPRTSIHVPILITTFVASAIMFTPIAYTLEIMVNYQMAPAIGFILSFLAISFLPALTFRNDLNSGFSKLITVMFFAVLIGTVWTGLQTVYTKQSPQHLNLHYVQSSSDSAMLALGGSHSPIPTSLENALPEKTKASTITPWYSWEFNTLNIDSQDIQSPKVSVNTLESQEGVKTVDLSVLTERKNLRSVAVYIPSNSGLISITSSGETLNYKGEENRYNGYYQFRCIGQSCATAQIQLNFEKDEPSKIYVSSVYTSLPEAFQHLPAERGNTAVTVQGGDQSTVFVNVEL